MKFDGLMWWISRWRRSTAYVVMSLEAQAGYRNLLDEATLRGGPIPNDENVLAKACGDPRRWPKIRTVVMKRFTLTPDGWRNETLDQVLKASTKRMQNAARMRHKRVHNSRTTSAQTGAQTPET